MYKLHKLPFTDKYLIDIKGNVYNVKRKRYLKPLTTGRGYVFYILYYNGIKKCHFRHRLLCSVFKPINGYEKLSVNHINGIPGDDRLENLEFITIRDNIKKYHKNKVIKKYPSVIVRYIKQGKTITYNKWIDAAKALNIHRYELLRRLSYRFGFIFKDYTMVKWGDNKQEFPNIINPIIARLECELAIGVKIYNHITKEELSFKTANEACKYLHVSPSIFSSTMNSKKPILKSGWEIKRITDNSNWSLLSKEEAFKLFNTNKGSRPIVVKDIKNNISLQFKTGKEAAIYFKCTPTKIWYRLIANKYVPSKDGFVYRYLDEML